MGISRKHAGIDIYRDKGTPVGAAQGGWVRRASGKEEHKTYGALVIIDHTPKLQPEDDPNSRLYQYTLYAHLDSVSTIVGTRVTQGETIGTVGKTGNAKGMKHHLHFEILRSSKKLDWQATYRYRCKSRPPPHRSSIGFMTPRSDPSITPWRDHLAGLGDQGRAVADDDYCEHIYRLA